MKHMSTNQMNELWRNIRLTITSIIFPFGGIIFAIYCMCPPIHRLVDKEIQKAIDKIEERKLNNQ